MAKSVVVDIDEEITLNGVTHTVRVGSIVRATPRSGGIEYARLQLTSGNTFLWSGDINDVDENTDEENPLWIPE